MTHFDAPTFRKILETALARGDIKHPELLECVTSYMVTGVSKGVDENEVEYERLSSAEIAIDAVLYSLERNPQNLVWVRHSYTHLLSKYPITKTHTHETTDNVQS